MPKNPAEPKILDSGFIGISRNTDEQDLPPGKLTDGENMVCDVRRGTLETREGYMRASDPQSSPIMILPNIPGLKIPGGRVIPQKSGTTLHLVCIPSSGAEITDSANPEITFIVYQGSLGISTFSWQWEWTEGTTPAADTSGSAVSVAHTYTTIGRKTCRVWGTGSDSRTYWASVEFDVAGETTNEIWPTEEPDIEPPTTWPPDDWPPDTWPPEEWPPSGSPRPKTPIMLQIIPGSKVVASGVAASYLIKSNKVISGTINVTLARGKGSWSCSAATFSAETAKTVEGTYTLASGDDSETGIVIRATRSTNSGVTASTMVSCAKNSITATCSADDADESEEFYVTLSARNVYGALDNSFSGNVTLNWSTEDV